MALCVHVDAVRASSGGTNEERARHGVRRIPLSRAVIGNSTDAVSLPDAAGTSPFVTPGVARTVLSAGH